MEVKEILEILNRRYKNKYVFEVSKSNQIVGFVDDNTFENIIAIIEPTESEMDLCIEHIDLYN